MRRWKWPPEESLKGEHGSHSEAEEEGGPVLEASARAALADTEGSARSSVRALQSPYALACLVVAVRVY